MTVQKPDLKQAFRQAMQQMGSAKLTQSSFNEAIGASRFMEVGEHNSTIQSAELTVGDYGPQIIVVWANEIGATIKQYVSLFMQDEKTKGVKYARGFISLVNAMGNNIAVQAEFIETLVNQASEGGTTLIDGMVGGKATVVVQKGKKGVEIIADGVKFKVVDVTTGDQVIPTSFFSISDAAKMAKEDGFQRAFNKVHYVKPIEAELEANQKSLEAALKLSRG